MNKAIQLQQNYAPRVCQSRISVLRIQRDTNRAIEDYDKAIKLDPKLAQPYNNRGNAYTGRKKNRDRAILGL